MSWESGVSPRRGPMTSLGTPPSVAAVIEDGNSYLSPTGLPAQGAAKVFDVSAANNHNPFSGAIPVANVVCTTEYDSNLSPSGSPTAALSPNSYRDRSDLSDSPAAYLMRRSQSWTGWVSSGDDANSAPEFGGARKLGKRIGEGAQIARSKWRKTVTGDQDRRIRDLLREVGHDAVQKQMGRARKLGEQSRKLKERVVDRRIRKAQQQYEKIQEQPKLMRQLDSLSFTGGVMGIIVTEMVMCMWPQWFDVLYAIIMPGLIITRYILYKPIKFHYFLVDFCYYVQVMLFVQLLWPDEALFRLCFAFANGPLAWAAIVWRNSLVWHSWDKVSSVYIHVYPMLVTFCWRWRGRVDGGCAGPSFWQWACGQPNFTFTTNTLFVPLCFYIIWQTSYLILTEWLGPPATDKTLVTSLRWLTAAGEKSSTVKLVKGICVKIGYMSKEEKFDANNIKTLMVMVVFQFVYTIFTLLPTWAMYRSELLHFTWMMMVISACVYNGAGYYFEVFASSYKFAKDRKKDQKLVSPRAEGAEPEEKVPPHPTQAEEGEAKEPRAELVRNSSTASATRNGIARQKSRDSASLRKRILSEQNNMEDPGGK